MTLAVDGWRRNSSRTASTTSRVALTTTAGRSNWM
jgi:hypothetical protein